MSTRRTNEECIIQEILRLQVIVASIWDDYGKALQEKAPQPYILQIANEYCLNRHNLRCLQFRNFKNMTYNVKLLFDK